MNPGSDLSRLRIDRSAPPPRRRRGPASLLGRALPWLLVGAVLVLFRARVSDFVDRLRLPEVQVVRAVRPSRAAQAALSGVAANGHVVARVRAALSADTPGRIVEMNVVEGQRVRAGEVVARLYDGDLRALLARSEAETQVAEAQARIARSDLEAARLEVERLEAEVEAAASDVEAAEAELRLARLQEERARRLVEQGVESQGALDEAKRNLDRAAAALDAARSRRRSVERSLALARARIGGAEARVAEADATVAVRRAEVERVRALLDKTVIRAPFDGVVVLKDAEVGEVVSPNSQAGSNARGSVATMVDFSSLEAQAEVPETTLPAVRVGAPARIFLDAYPERPYPGHVDRIWPTADRQKATIEVRVAFDERDDRLRPEMGLRVVFLSEEPPPAEEPERPADDVVLVPADAVVRIDGRPGVFVLERDRARFRPVALGERSGTRVAVTDGLAPEEEVVLRPPRDLEDGDRVRVAGG